MAPNPKPDDPNLLLLGGTALGAAALTYYMTRKDAPIDPLYDFDNQSIEIDEKEHIRINTLMKGKPLVEYRLPDVRTLFDILPKGLEVSGNGECMGEREGRAKGPYSWVKYSEVMERVRCIGSGLLNNGIVSSNDTRIGIYSANRIEWVVSEHACYSFSFQVVSLYDSYGRDAIKYILNHAEIKVVFVDNFERLSNILENINEFPHLQLIVHFDKLTYSQVDQLKNYNLENVQVLSYKDLMVSGRENLISPKPPKPTDIATICYTSGTTGAPKGAIISHANIIAAEAAIQMSLCKPHLNYVPTNITHMSYLPFAHMLERQASVDVFINGGRLGFISGDVATTLLDDVQELKPTDMPMVPRLLNRFYNQVMNKVKGNPIKLALMNRAIAAKNADRLKGIFRNNTIYDKLVFNKIREVFGGRVHHVATGSAPISDEVLTFSKAVFGCPIAEGYGQTEATCAITFTHPFDPSHGHVGPPVSTCMVKLVDVPEMGYFSDKNQGEVCAKGTTIVRGYLKEEEKTREAIDEAGWLHTGDIGMWLPNGTLRIIDRKKNLFKLSQGEYISPEKIESVYARSPFIAQIVVEGNPLKDFTVAIVVPEPVYFEEVCQKMNITGSIEERCQNKKIRKVILEELTKLGKEAGLMSYEQVRSIHLHPEMFTLQNELATPTMKIKRMAVRQQFKGVVTGLYTEYENMTKSKL